MTGAVRPPSPANPPLRLTFAREHVQEAPRDPRTGVVAALRAAGHADAGAFPPFVRVGQACYVLSDAHDSLRWAMAERDEGALQRLPWTAELHPRAGMTAARFSRRLAELARVASSSARNWEPYVLATEALTDRGGPDAERLEDAFCLDFVAWNDRTQEGTWELLVRLLELNGAALLYDGNSRAYAAADGVAASFDLGWRLDPFSARGPVATWRPASAQLVHPEAVWHALDERIESFERFVRDGALPQRSQVAVGVGPDNDGSTG